MKEKFYLTTAIAYTSGKPHIGNTYEIVLADAIARFKRLEGYDVYFQTGTDEHGEKIEQKAYEANKSPQEFVDKNGDRYVGEEEEEGVESYDITDDSDDNNPTFKIYSAISPEVGLLGKIGPIVLRYTFQYRFAISKEYEDKIKSTRHVFGIGFCF